MEVVLHAQNNSLVLRNAFDFVAPFPGNLDTSFHSLSARVHGQDHVEAEELCDKFRKLGEYIVVESTGAQRESRSLVNQHLDQLRMAVALVHGRVGGEEIEIGASLGVPDSSTSSAGKDDRKRVVVVGSILMLCVDGGGG